MISSMLLATAVTLMIGAYIFGGFAIAKAFGWGGPYLREIPRPNGAPYLNRWSIRFQDAVKGGGPWRAYLHQFFAPDSEGHHNHPSAWNFSVVLWGSYTEEYFDAPPNELGSHQIRTRRVRWFNWIGRHRFHRITELHGNVWTLFFCGPLTGEGWGFFVDGRGFVRHDARKAERRTS